VALLSLCSVLLYRRSTGVRIVPISTAEVERICGSDLLAVNSRSGNLVSSEEAVSLGNACDALRASMGTTRSMPLPEEVRSLWLMAGRIRALTAGRIFDTSALDETSTGEGANFDATLAIKRMTGALCDLVKMEADRRNGDGCHRAVLEALEMDRLLHRSAGSSVLAYISLEGLRFTIGNAIDKAVQSGVFDSNQLRSIFAGIEPGDREDSVLASAIQADFRTITIGRIEGLASASDIDRLYWKQRTGFDQFMADSNMTGLLGSPSGERYVFASGELDKPATLRMAVGLVREMLANCRTSWKGHTASASNSFDAQSNRLPEPPNLDTKDSWFKKAWATAGFHAKMQGVPNALGLWLISSSRPFDAVQQSCRYRTMREGLRLRLLLEIYRKLHQGRLPSSLAEVAPLCGSRPMPVDYFEGGPFRYSASRRLFWSVDKNVVDDGGNMKSRFAGPDIAWAIP
jgi:hypothetical protein